MTQRCSCGQYAKPATVWVGFNRILDCKPECKACAIKRRMTETLRREVKQKRQIDPETEFMMGL